MPACKNSGIYQDAIPSPNSETTLSQVLRQRMTRFFAAGSLLWLLAIPNHVRAQHSSCTVLGDTVSEFGTIISSGPLINMASKS